MASNLLALGFQGATTANSVCPTCLRCLEERKLINLDDAVVAFRPGADDSVHMMLSNESPAGHEMGGPGDTVVEQTKDKAGAGPRLRLSRITGRSGDWLTGGGPGDSRCGRSHARQGHR